MKDLRKISLLIAIFVLSISFSTSAKSVNKNINDAGNNSSEMIMKSNTFIVEFMGIFHIPAYNLLVNINSLTANDLILEETLELEEWMLDYNWVEAEESLIEEEMQLEVWMQRPQNWNIYQCGANAKN
jgi:hypothetical protein